VKCYHSSQPKVSSKKSILDDTNAKKSENYVLNLSAAEIAKT
jgi:hypothetical protein